MKDKFIVALEEGLEKVKKQKRYCSYCIVDRPHAFNLIRPKDSEPGKGTCSVCGREEKYCGNGYTMIGAKMLLESYVSIHLGQYRDKQAQAD